MTVSVRRFASAGFIRHAVVWLAVVAAALGAGAARAARVVDVRIGLHGDHTRVVIELDAPSGHHVERPAGDADTLTVRLDARSERRHVLSRSPLVEGVTLEPGDGGAVARIALRDSGLDYSEMLLDAPPRIVIDVRRAGVAAASPPTAAELASTAAKPTEPVAAAAPPEPAADEAGIAAAAPQARDPFAPPASYRALVAAQQAAAEAPAPPSDPPAEPVPSAPLPPAVSGAVPTAAVSAAPARVPANPPQMAGLPPQIAAAIEPLRGWLAGVDPSGAVLVLAGLVVSWIFYRRMLARRTRQRAIDEVGADLTIFGDASHTEPAPAEDPGATAISAARTVAVPAVEDSVAEEPAAAPEPVRVAKPEIVVERTVRQLSLVMPSEEPAHGWQTLPVPPASAGPEIAAPQPTSSPPPEASEDRVAILERRIVRLEGRIEELLESRQRLERYAAAQNEELRVQRAAIARTQRVLRGVVRPEEGGGDPARVVPPPPVD